ncbi:aminopeptidase P family protein [Salisaeta longa]|uniref:aminopeptidase P family protein n=1 Tax=Salisaeta longa TaxID=503170 RepID=UPI0003B6F18A|nr:aminopeptidase P family protein [Salisaeta longa]
MFDASEYTARRRTLLDTLDEGLVVLLGNGPSPQNYADNLYPFWQDSTVMYYAGVDRPKVAVALDVESGAVTLYGDDPSLDDVVWMGPQPALEDRAARAGIEATAPWAQLAADVQTAQAGGRTVHLLPPYRAAHRQTWANLLAVAPAAVDEHVSEPLIRAVVAQRSVKSAAEVTEIERAVRTTARMHTTAMRMAAPGVHERTIAGRLEGIARASGGRLAFSMTCSVHGEVLHNHHQTDTLADGDLLLVDAGATAPSYYAGDITRTMPVSGAFTTKQRAIYEAVLAAQHTALAQLRPGVPFRDVHLAAARTLTEHLQSIGLMMGDVEASVQAGAHALFFPHGLGHMMGLDVHDMEGLGEAYVGYTEAYTRSEQFGLSALRLARPLAEGFVVTVEPGCYFIPALIDRWKADDRHTSFINYGAVEAFRSLGGVRIEDDVLITSDGYRVLGPPIPKAPEEVLAEMERAVEPATE